MIDPTTFQPSVMSWQLKNFPRVMVFKHQPLLGIVEEIGELCEALEDLGVKNPDENNLKIRDAIGDIMIFMAAFCGANGLNILMCAEAWTHYSDPMLTSQQEAVADLPRLVGRLAHAFLKNEQGIRGHGHSDRMREVIGKLCSVLSTISQGFGWDILDIVEETWAEVSKRDWAKFPKNGLSDEKPKREPMVMPERKPGIPGKFHLTIRPKTPNVNALKTDQDFKDEFGVPF